MSKETLDQFIQQISDSEELQAQIGEEIDADSLIALGAEHGCEFSAEDLTAGAELSDEELDEVAGGWSFHISPWNKFGPVKVIGYLNRPTRAFYIKPQRDLCEHCGVDLNQMPHTHFIQQQ